ncbi:MAG: DUF4097 family beta strand repeat-containing protein [Aristaeellaceae bacterium]
MNATVERIVELLFEDLEPTDEVKAIKDEVMNNCQERFGDLLKQGLSEDEAIGAVVESLKGMEDVLAQYPRKAAAQTCGKVDGDGLIFPAEGLNSIQANLFSETVHVEASDDEHVHVLYERENMEDITVRMSGGCLSISRTEDARQKSHAPAWQASIHSLSDLGKFLRNLPVSVHFDDEQEITIALPRTCVPDVSISTLSGDVSMDEVAAKHATLTTTSGDITVQDVMADALTVNTTSGALNVALPEDTMLARAELRTTSGDVEAQLNAQHCKAQSMSGDVTLEGRIREADVSSVSGDVHVRADVEQVRVQSVSGDIDATCDSDELREVTAKSTSGDVHVHLPGGVRSVCLYTTTVSGDVSYDVCTDSSALVQVRVSTVSGDINVR